MTQKTLSDILDYDPMSGSFTWKKRDAWNRDGREAGCIDKRGYRVIRINGKAYKAHRLAWLYMTGEWPAQEIDHITVDNPDNRKDNRWVNLRCATPSQNMWNKRKQTNNTSGFKGVVLDKSSNKWRASIRHEGKRYNLGSYPTPAEAHAAYCSAADVFHGPFARTD